MLFSSLKQISDFNQRSICMPPNQKNSEILARPGAFTKPTTTPKLRLFSCQGDISDFLAASFGYWPK